MTLHFTDIRAEPPPLDSLAKEYAAIEVKFDAAESADERMAAVGDWDAVRRRLDSWLSLAHLRFHQDTTDEDYKRARDLADEMRPKLTELDVRLKRKLLESEHLHELEERFGEQFAALWQADVLSYDPVIEDDMVREAKLEAEYTELLASARFDFRGESHNLSGLGKFREDSDRVARRETETLRWKWFDENRPALDRIYGELVALRHGMANKLNFKDFVELGYRRMCRVDYAQVDVERFRAEVREHVVPLAGRLRERQARSLGVDRLMFWDEALYDAEGNPAPLGDHDWLLERAQEMFDRMGGGLDEFFRQMNEGGFLDLKNREGKAGGGFCTSFASYGFPFIYANFNGTKGDVEVFTHEVGHAFQNYLSRSQPLYDYLWPTYESCEIHSMSLEFLTWPHMEKFFGERAERFRTVHLEQSLCFLPYGVAVDHFQHLVYARPEATPNERHAMWREMEETYLPWRDYGDLPHVDRGGRWQLQWHIYGSPFYYIDYTLALTCALQFWLRAEEDPAEAMESYVALCKRGGEAPFQQLARSAGLVSPFEEGSLAKVVARARQRLAI